MLQVKPLPQSAKPSPFSGRPKENSTVTTKTIFGADKDYSSAEVRFGYSFVSNLFIKDCLALSRIQSDGKAEISNSVRPAIGIAQ